MPHFTVHGTPFDCSYQVGKRFHREIKACLRHYCISPLALKQQGKHIQEYYHYCQRHYPQYLQEIAGLAEGSKTDFLELFYLNCPELSQTHHGCSSIAFVEKGKKNRERNVRKKGNLLLAHNEDGEPGEKGALITYQLPNTTFHSFVYHGELPGSAYNWNEHGLFFTINYIPVLSLKKGAPYYFLTRNLLECPSLAVALPILRKSSCASGFHAYIGQGKIGLGKTGSRKTRLGEGQKEKIFSVEKWGKKTSIKEVKGLDLHTNHFLHPGMRSEVRKGSLLRLKRLQELLAPQCKAKASPHDQGGKAFLYPPSKKIKTKNHPGVRGTAPSLTSPSLTSREALKILSDRKNRPYPLYSTAGDKSRTLSTVVFEEGNIKIYEKL